MPECPKCQGGAYLVEEELVKVLETTEPIKIIARVTYQCRACGERFSRLIYENLDSRKKQADYAGTTSTSPTTTPTRTYEPADSLRFLDTV